MVSKKLNYDEVMKLINVNIHNGTQAKIPGIFELIRDEDKKEFQFQLVNNILNIIDERVEMSAPIYRTIYYLQQLTRKLTIWINRKDEKTTREANKIIKLLNSQSKLRKVI